jgi:hypothetical protein
MAAANVPEGLGLVLGGATVSLFVVYFGALRATLRRREGEAGALSATTVIAGSVMAAAALVAVAIDDSDLTMLLAFPAATVLVAPATGILSTGALPRPWPTRASSRRRCRCSQLHHSRRWRSRLSPPGSA